MSTQCCLGEYKFACASFPDVDGNVYIDSSKTRQVVVVSPCGTTPVLPSSDAILRHEILNCPNSQCDIRWYECVQTFGRVYTILPTACEVLITNYENGFLKTDACDASTFGTESFCFGRVYVSDKHYATSKCKTIFEFDGHIFEISGETANSFGLFDCSSCQDSIQTFGIEGKGESVPDAPPVATREEVDALQSSEIAKQREDRVLWDSQLSETVDSFISCSPEESVGIRADCESQDNPAIARLPTGHSIIAFEQRRADGIIGISLAVLNSTVPNKVYYYRSLSFGTLVNDSQFVYGSGTFDIYDDVLFDLNDIGEPSSPLSIGFLSGPLKGGQPFNILTITRSIQTNGRPKHSIIFDSIGIVPNFEDSNDVNNVSFFILESTQENPGGDQLESIIDIPQHTDSSGEAVPMSSPSIAVSENNIMIDGTQNIFLTYQAFEDNMWKIYMIQFRLSERNFSLPTYVSPYEFNAPSTQEFSIDDGAILKYRVTSITHLGGILSPVCVLFEAYLPNDTQITTCPTDSGQFTHPCGHVVNNSIATVEIVYQQTECSYVFNLNIGDEITAPYPPVAENFPDGTALGGTSTCIDSFSVNPDVSNWCYTISDCPQFYVKDDPYCPLPYVAYIYKPEDLWVINVGEDLVTRVKYHISVSGTSQTPATSTESFVDFMFVIDYSGSMSGEIQDIITQIPTLSQNLINQGISARFGLTVFGRQSNGDPNAVGCSGCWPGSYVFNGLYGLVNGGFTESIQTLQTALGDISANGAGPEPGYSAISYALSHSQYDWRSNAKRVIFLVTDTTDESGTCVDYNNSQNDAISLIQQYGVAVGLAISDQGSPDGCIGSGAGYLPLLEVANPSLGSFNVNGPYSVIFNSLSIEVGGSIANARVVERDTSGYGSTFLNNAEVYITYSGDLTDIWTNEKSRLVFIDNAPIEDGTTKGLTQTPYQLAVGKVFNIDPVHTKGNVDNWVFFNGTGQIRYTYPYIGVPQSGRTSPILISSNSTKAAVKTNNRNEVFVVYEKHETGLPQIEIVGTGDLHQNSITGPKGCRLTKFYTSEDFSWMHAITDFSEGANQLCDVVIDKNDVSHIVWQSNRDKRWEIYYANSYDMFTPVRVTSVQSKSAMPKIDVDVSGTIYVVYQDNRFGPFEIMLAAKDERRIIPLTQQDAYLASLRAQYNHYTNTMPIYVTNQTELVPIEGALWGTKTASGNNNAEENFIFSINPDTGEKIPGCDPSPFEINAIASSRNGFFYGIDSENKLLLIDDIDQDAYGDFRCSDISVVGSIDLPTESTGIALLSDEFSGSDIADPLVWIQRTMHSFDPIDGPGGPWFIVNVNAIQSAGSLTYGEPPAPISNQCGSIYGIITANPILPRSISIRARIKWTGFSPENYNSPQATFVIKNTTTGSPLHSISFRQNQCSGSGCTQDLIITYSDGPDATISDFAPFKNNWVDLRIDCVETDGNVNGRKNLTITVFINNVQYYNHTRNNLSSTDSGMGTYYGFGSYSYFLPSAPEYSTGYFLVDSISYINIESNAIENSQVLDMSFDHVERLWLLVGDRLASGILNLRLLQLDKTSGSINNEKTIYTGVSERTGALSILNDGTFYIVSYRSNSPILSRASYPSVSLNAININLVDVTTLTTSIRVMTSDFEDQIFAADKDNNLYIMSPSGSLTFKSDLSIPDTEDPYADADPLGTLAGLGYKFTGRFDSVGDSKSFHVVIEFYDNINLEGDPTIVVDSRTNLESFINTVHEDAYFSSSRGIELLPGHSAIIYFDASHFRPGKSDLAYPYSFDSNQTYFPKIFLIGSDGIVNVLNDVQNTSFSCNKCTKLGDNNFDTHGCSFSFTIEEPGYYNFIIDIYGDEDYSHKIATYEAKSGNADLEYFEVNNVKATNVWKSSGLEALAGDFVQLYPTLDPNSGMLCGITYYVKVKKCDDLQCNNPINFNNGTFLCECSSNIFGNSKLKALSDVARWESSGSGFADTRVTDTTGNKINPSIKTRSSSAAIILFEDHSTSPISLKGATFRKSSPNDQLSSGTRSWFDYNFNTYGEDHAETVDLYDRVSMVYKKQDAVFGNGSSDVELPTSTLHYKSCNFSESGESITPETCDISSLESNIITSDSFITDEIVKKIIIHKDDVDYYSYNAAGDAVPVVSSCQIRLQIWGTPEVVAYRLRNENQRFWSSWCAYSPEIGEYYTETKWTISPESGIKEICLQLMTYSGITAEKCFPIVGDYAPVIFETKIFTDENYNELLPTFDGMFVASTLFNKTTGIAASSRSIYIEIIPNTSIQVDVINFDVLQQGVNDLYDLQATKTIGSDGREAFRGSFTINREDNVINKDGLARIKPKFPGTCEKDTFVTAPEGFARDQFNLLTQGTSAVEETPSDNLADYRQEISGTIGVGIIIRPTEDPYFIFGNPDFYLNVKEPKNRGVLPAE